MRAVLFTEDIKSIEITGLSESTIIVVHEMYDAPKIKGHVIPWQEFKMTYPNYNADQYVIVGLNRMISPSNRCDMVNDFLQIMTKSIEKISIDTAPFIGEPWRLWFHYSIAFGEWLGVDYSYPVEGEWEKWFYRDQNFCKISQENLSLYVKNTYSKITPLITEFNLLEPSNEEFSFYDEAKKAIFEKYETPKNIISNLLKVCNNHYKLEISFNSYLSNQKLFTPNLGVYKFMKEENDRRQSIYNYFANGETINENNLR